MSDFLDGSTHFKEFYGKLNVISEIISKKKTTITNTRTTFDTIFGKSKSDDETATLKAILNKQHDSTLLVETFDYPKQKETEGTDYITKKFNAGNFQNQNERIEVKIKFDVEVSSTQVWFNDELVSIFNINNEDTKPNIKELSTSDHTEIIKHLFTFKSLNPVQYVWESKYDMLALFNQPFLLLTFDMYYYNIKNEPLFKNNFDVKEDTGATAVKPLTLESLLNIDTFYGKLPTFLMLLIYYAGYRFNIKVEDITSKFRNKFNGKSFDIKLYAPIPDKMETKYNNLLRSLIKPTSVDLNFETLEVYHVGSKVNSLWDYVNGKLTILINNMLNSKDKDDKNRYKSLFKKQYTSNSLFLFECIAELKKYKEYILNPANITTIAFPMSTLKTLEILILKLSYILSVLEPTFIPIETMSFDVIMNGKTLKYVINSELQATNISIDDYISNDKLMSAILSTRAAVIETNDTGKTKAKNLLSDSTALELQKSVIQKQADLYRRNYLEKNIAYQRINSEFSKSAKSLEQLKTGLRGFTDETLNTNILYMNHVVQHAELDLANEIASFEKEYSEKRNTAATALLNALSDTNTTTGTLGNYFKSFVDVSAEPNIENNLIGEARKRLTEAKQLLQEATKISPEQQALLKAAAERADALNARTSASIARRASATASAGGDIPVTFTVEHKHNKEQLDSSNPIPRRFGLGFGVLETAMYTTFQLGKILSIDNRGRPTEFTNPADTSKTIKVGFLLNKIELVNQDNSTSRVWDATIAVPPDKASGIIDNAGPAKTLLTGTANQSYRTKIIAFQHFLNILDGLDVDKKYTFHFNKPEPTISSTVESFSGGKNTTKKVNRKQRQIQSKKKKSF